MTSLALVATDLDHTFLGADQRPSELNTHSMFAAAEHGAAVVFATGRPLRWLDLLEVFTDVNPTVIASNGAVTYDLRNHRVISDTPFPIDVITDVVNDIASELPEAKFSLEEAQRCCVEPGFDRVDHGRPVTHQGPIHEFLTPDSRPVKMLVRAFDIPTEELFEIVDGVVDGRVSTTFSVQLDDGLVELAPIGVSKGAALSATAEQLGVDLADAAAFGDMPNDLSMLRLVGHPFVVSNAHRRVLQEGFPVIGHHDTSAVGHAILDLLDGRQPATVS